MQTLRYPHLLSPLDLGICQLKTSVVMAPMTRCRANSERVPTEEMVQFYRARARDILIIGEATAVRWDASSYENCEIAAYVPGIYNLEQAEGWRKVADGVHAVGGTFFLQLWHAGPLGHRAFRKEALPLSASAVAPLKKFVPRSQEKLLYEVPKAMDEHDFEDVKQAFVQAAIYAIKEANCDGIELHGASGYLLNSFLTASTNQREDKYGGSSENRCRFVLEVVDAVIEAVAKIKEGKRVGIRLSPVPLLSMESVHESKEDQETFRFLLKELNHRPLAYVHAASDHDHHPEHQGMLGKRVSLFIREHYRGVVIGGGSYSLELAERVLENKDVDLVYFGRSFIANPKLLDKIEKGEGSDTLVAFNPKTMLNFPPIE